MLEEEWLASHDPAAILRCLERGTYRHLTKSGWMPSKPSDRKLRLIVAAVLREAIKGGWNNHAEDDGSDVIDKVELWADKGILPPEGSWDDRNNELSEDGKETAVSMSSRIIERWGEKWQVTPEKKAGIIREIIGNPFRSVDIGTPVAVLPGGLVSNGKRWPRWYNSTVVTLAKAVYDDRAFDRLPILADALEEAGCDNDVLLQHLKNQEHCPRCLPFNNDPEVRIGCGDMNRDKWGFCNGGWIKLRSSHVRGCWALDLILGRE